MYQRLIKLEYSHVQVTMLYTFLNIVLGFMALLFYQTDDLIAFALMLSAIIPYFILLFTTYMLERKRLRSS